MAPPQRFPPFAPRAGHGRKALLVALALGATAALWALRDPTEDLAPAASLTEPEAPWGASSHSGAQGGTRAPTPEAEPGEDRPAAVARIVAQLLSGAPALDPSQLGAMIDRALDPSLPNEDRVGAIRWLARFGSDEALDVLERLLRGESPSAIRAAVAMALGSCPHPEATRILTALLGDDDPDVVLGAVHGLSRRVDPAAGAALRSLIADEGQPEVFRTAAAAALGRHDDASGALRDALARSEGDLTGGALEGLARQPFPENEALFRQLLGDPEVSLDVKVDAIDALGEGTPEAAEYLLEVARSGSDPELRSAAIDALALFDEPGEALGGIATLVATEPDPAVRAALYGALAFHAAEANAASDGRALVRSALAETSPRAQLEGYRMVASMLRQQPEPETAVLFDANMVVWLQSSAEGGDRYTRHLSIDALKLAGTPTAREALLDLSHSTDPSVSESAEKALRIAARIGAQSVP